MKVCLTIKRIFFFSLFLTISNTYFAQDDYVISKPIEPQKKASNILFGKMDDPDFTNYFFTASAYTLKSRDIRISNTDILFTKGSYGLTNNTTASINFSFFGTITGSLKHKIELNEALNLGFSVGGGSLATIGAGSDSIMFIGGGQSMITYGNHNDNITFGIGYYHVKSTFEFDNGDDEIPLYKIYVGLQKQIGRRVFILADGMYFADFNLFTGGIGVKIIIKDYMTLLLGVMPITQEYNYLNSTQIRESVILPVISYRIWLDRH